MNLEKRFYPLAEIKELMNTKRKETITNNLTKWNYQYEWIPYKGVNIIKAPEEGNAEEQLQSALMRILDLDSRTDFKAFAAMFYLMVDDEEFQTMPWEARAARLKDEFGIEISDRTLRTYMQKLILNDIAIKDDSQENKEYWKTTYVCGIEKCQSPVLFDEEEEMHEWFRKRIEYVHEADKLYQEAMQDPEAKNPKRWNIAMRKLWDETKTCYYPVSPFVFNGFKDEEYKELYKLSALVVAGIDLSDEDVEEIEEKVVTTSSLLDGCVAADGSFKF